MWIVQYVNSAVILIIINNQLSGGLIQRVLDATGLSSFIFNGEYEDYNSDWYAVVGITIFTTAFITGITPVTNFMLWGIADFKRCCDRGCSFDKKKTKKIIQEEYEAVYSGKLIEFDNRFSVIIAMIWVIMTFSAAIPVLYMAGFILCFVTYWTDKSLFLKFYKIPPKHGSHLAH